MNDLLVCLFVALTVGAGFILLAMAFGYPIVWG